MRRTVGVGAVGSALLLGILASGVKAQQDTAAVGPHVPGRIIGVFDDASGQPIPGADVVDLIAGGVAHTDAHGLVELSEFQRRDDSAAVRVRKIGYADTAFIVTVGRADTIPIQVNLRKSAVVLPKITTNAEKYTLEARKLADFESRRKAGFGRYILSDELLRYSDRQVRDVLADHGMTGMKIPGCSMKYVINGDISASSPMMVELLKSDPGDDLIAVEYYEGAKIPAEFSGLGACSLAILWTRRY